MSTSDPKGGAIPTPPSSTVFADTRPAALRHPSVQLVAPLTRKTALVGRHETTRLDVTPRQVNQFIACTASDWVAGPTRKVVDQAIQDRNATLTH